MYDKTTSRDSNLLLVPIEELFVSYKTIYSCAQPKYEYGMARKRFRCV